MKVSTAVILFATTTAATITNALIAPSTTGRLSGTNKIAANRRHGLTLKMSEVQSEVEKLRAAAAKARAEAVKLARELGKEVDDAGNIVSKLTAPDPKAKESVSSQDIQALASSIDFERDDAKSQTEKLNELVTSGDFTLWKSAVRSSSLRTFPVSLQFLESRTNKQITVDALGFGTDGDVSMDDFRNAALGVTVTATVVGIAALAFLPDNIGATICYFAALVPILFLAVGSTAPGLIAVAITSVRGGNDKEGKLADRVCRHEAGHFLCGYLCGLPIAGYSTAENGVPCVEFHPSQNGPVTGREFSQEEIAALSCVAMSGSVAEVLGLGDARGGESDLIQLDGFFRRSAEFIGAQKQQDLTRWGALASYNLINDNRSKYDLLVEAFKAQKSVPECIAILESR